MPAPPRTESVTPLLGAVAIRRAHRSLLAVIVALLVFSTAAHHLVPRARRHADARWCRLAVDAWNAAPRRRRAPRHATGRCAPPAAL